MKKLLSLILAVLMLGTIISGCGRREDENKMDEEIKLEAAEDSENVYIDYSVLSPEIAAELSPNLYNLELAAEKGLCEKDIYDGSYLEMQAAYMALLNYWLCRDAGLDDYQKKLDENRMNFPAGDEERAEKLSGSFGRNNIFIRNLAYVEQLEKDELELLAAAMEEGKLKVDDELIDMLILSFPRVIKQRLIDTEDEYSLIYENGLFGTLEAPNTALVFQIDTMPEFDEKGMLISQENEDKKFEYLQIFSSEMAENIGLAVGCQVRVFY